MEQIKVYNRTKHNVGVVLLNGIGRNVPPGGFLLADSDQVRVWASTTTLFTAKHLTLDDTAIVEEVTGLKKEDLQYDNDQAILNKLKRCNLPTLKKYLEGIAEHHEQMRLKELALQADLPNSKIKLIGEIFNVAMDCE